MSKSKIFQISSIVITFVGVAYMGYSDAKGIANNYGWWIMGFGVALSIFTLLFMKEKEKT